MIRCPADFLKKGRKNDPKGQGCALEEMRKKYYHIRSYDDNGKPTARIMKKLAIQIH